MTNFKIPLTVPGDQKSKYRRNYELATNYTGRLLLLAGDQKVEHLNDDFFGSRIAAADASPEHLFKIATGSKGVLLAAHLGLIARYGQDYPQIPYLVKINGRTNLGPNEEKNSSKCWWKVENIVKFQKQSGLKIVGIGYTLYLGGKYEAKMLAKIAKAFLEAHQNGLIAVLWVYPRGKNIKEEDIHTIAGGAGVAACLNADFVKVKYPYNTKDKKATAKKFQEVTRAAGRTKVICVGGSQRPIKELITELSQQIKISKTAGLAIGRNLHQRPLEEALRLTKALGAIIFKEAELKEALKIYTAKNRQLRKLPNF
jgi:fructose-bisphosphate aldolase/6-deoxy-5-ketofructose 1-phosphate synthase